MRGLAALAIASALLGGAGPASAAVVHGANGPFFISSPGTQGYGVNLATGTGGVDTFAADFIFQTSGAPDGGSTAIECVTGCASLRFADLDLFKANGSNAPIGSSLSDGNVGIAFGSVDFGTITSFGALTAGKYLVRVVGSFVTSGDSSIGGTVSLSTVPLPAAAWLFGSALLGLCWSGRRCGIGSPTTLPS